MLVAYITNDHPLYLHMTLNGLKMIRHFNRRIPIRISFINQQVSYPALNTSKEQLFKYCDDNHVEVVRYDLPEDWFGFEKNRDIWVFRFPLQDCPDDSVLYLESDTFVFGDVEPIFWKYQHADIVAVPGDWAPQTENWSAELLDGKLTMPFNPGIVLWNHGWLQKWAARYLQMTKEILAADTARPELKAWLYATHPTAKHTEELTLCTFTTENDLAWSFFCKADADVVRNEEDLGKSQNTVLWHTYSQFWMQVYYALRGRRPRLIKSWKK